MKLNVSFMIKSPCDSGYINRHAWDKWDKYNIQLHPKVLSIKIWVANGLDADVPGAGEAPGLGAFHDSRILTFSMKFVINSMSKTN